MKRTHLSPLLAGLLVVLLAGCDAGGEEPEDPSGVFTLTGYVVDAATGDPLENAVVEISPSEIPPLRTDAEGFYRAEVEIDSTTSLTVSVRKTNYTSDTQEVVALADFEQKVPDFRLAPTSEERISGTPSNILLVGQSQDHIGIVGSGAPEVASVTFQVTDSAGTPVTLGNDALVHFGLGQNPGGGAFIAPQQARTNGSGEVTVNLSSGTAAGVVQVVASFDRADGQTIRSNPVSFTIHGGHPDADHFTMGPAQFNFPGLLRAGATNAISVIVGDAYGNPVRPGTAVYFTTSHGIIEGDILTDAQGGGSVNLTSADPFPISTGGVTVITAETAGNDNERISERIPVLMTGLINVRVDPGAATIGTTYDLEVTDELGNPLAKGTTIAVTAEGSQIKATGNTSVTLDDTAFRDQNGDGDALDAADVVKGAGITNFTFSVVEDPEPDNAEAPSLGSITISVGGPNGSLQCVINKDAGRTSCPVGAVAGRAAGSSMLLVGEPPSL